MVERRGGPAVRIMTIGLLAAGVVGMSGFAGMVAISWDVLRASLGGVALVALLVVVTLAAIAWASVLINTLRHRSRPVLTPSRRAGIAAVSLLAVVTGGVAVPSTRARLEHKKCHRVAAADAASQADCRTWLESRRQWWTLGLSHRDPGRGK
jgi:hypothetical protein